MNNSTKDFKIFLQSILIERCKRNSNYSLRSFAKSLEIDHSTLSQMIRGKRKISNQMKLRLGKKLDLGPRELENFNGSEEESSYPQLALDAFEAMSDWSYFAVLELIKVKGFASDPKYIAKRLGLTINEVRIVLERLVRLEMLFINKKDERRPKQLIQ